MRDDELRLLRRRTADVETATQGGDAAGRSADGSAAWVAMTATVSSYPTVARAVYGVKVQRVSVDETEGATPTFTDDSGVFYALNLGSKVPPVGTAIVIVRAGGIFVFRYD